MFDFEKLSASKLYAAPHVERVVEFSPPGIDMQNISKVLSLAVDARCTSAEPFDGYAEVAGRTGFRLTYLDREGNPKGVDLSAEFSVRADGEFIPTDNLTAEINVVETDVQADDALKLSAVLDVSVCAIRREELNILVDAEGCYKTSKDIYLPSFIASKTTASPFDAEQDAGGEVTSVLSMTTECIMKKAEATDGGASCAATVVSTVTYVEGGEIKQRRFEIDLEEELSLEGVKEGDAVSVQACIKNAKLVLQGVTDDNVLRVEGEAGFKIRVFRLDTHSVVSDIFDLSNETEITYEECDFTCFDGCGYFVEKAGGTAMLGDNRAAGIAVSAIPYAHAVTTKASLEDDGTLSVEGIVNADIIYTDENGFNSVRTEIPFSLSLTSEKQLSKRLKVGVQVQKISAELRREREIDIDMLLAISVCGFSTLEVSYISDITLGEEKAQNPSGISLYIARGGDGLLDLCKALTAMPDDILAQNPGLEFPLVEGQRVVYFRHLEM